MPRCQRRCGEPWLLAVDGSASTRGRVPPQSPPKGIHVARGGARRRQIEAQLAVRPAANHSVHGVSVGDLPGNQIKRTHAV